MLLCLQNQRSSHRLVISREMPKVGLEVQSITKNHNRSQDTLDLSLMSRLRTSLKRLMEKPQQKPSEEISRKEFKSRKARDSNPRRRKTSIEWKEWDILALRLYERVRSQSLLPNQRLWIKVLSQLVLQFETNFRFLDTQDSNLPSDPKQRRSTILQETQFISIMAQCSLDWKRGFQWLSLMDSRLFREDLRPNSCKMMGFP